MATSKVTTATFDAEVLKSSTPVLVEVVGRKVIVRTDKNRPAKVLG